MAAAKIRSELRFILNGRDVALRDVAADCLRHPRDLQPLPLLGIPGLTPESEDPAFYEDTWQFRPGRRRRDDERTTGRGPPPWRIA